MESAVEAKSEPVGEKRPAEDWAALPAKRVRAGSDRNSTADVKTVAEMVLVLAAMGKMRGGKGPADVEKELMAEARTRLAKVCQGFAPKDVFPSDAFGSMIEDLGLNKLKDLRLGFRPLKISIADKLLISKRKIEEAENFSLPSTPQSVHMQGNSATAADNRSVSLPIRMIQADKSARMSISYGSFQSPSPLTQSTPTSSTSLPYQLPTSEIRPVVSGALVSSHLTSTSLPRLDRPHLRPDARSQVPATYPGNSSVRTPTWSLQPPAVSSKSGSENKVLVNMPLKLEGAAGVRSGIVPQTKARSFAQTKVEPPSQGTNSIHHMPLVHTHAEIGKIVQKLLQPKILERSTWNPPSTDYMNKALTCQICLSTVTEIDSILICDACEKGYHLKCLQASNVKGVPRGEWHCGKCMSSSNGKPLPPKYGRVMRNVNTQKISSNLATVLPISSKSVSASSEKVSQPKVIVDGNTTAEKVPGVTAKNFGDQTSESTVREATGTQENYSTSSISKMDVDNKVSVGICPNSLTESSNSAAVAFINNLLGKESVDNVAELKPISSAEVVLVPNSSDDNSQASGKAVEASPFKQPLENHLVMRDSNEPHGDETTNNINLLTGQGMVPYHPTGVAASNGTMNPGRSSSDGLHVVNWVGEPIQNLDEKIYYGCCCINGYVYKLTDHVLVCSDNGKLIPSKLQAMWEDKNTTKWVMVNQCYFPSDLPEAVGRPCGLESSEVYESTRGTALMAGLIEGHCEVLPPRRFVEESEQRARMEKQPNDHLPPLYLCKWIYDEVKGLFRDISC